MKITQSDFGKAALFTLEGEDGITARVTSYGAILVSLSVPDAQGGRRDVVTGYDTQEEYARGGFFGATVGRHANRIAGASFTLDGVRYELCTNEGRNNLHSSRTDGFHKRLCDSELLPDGVRFSLVSEDGDAGFPGELHCSVSYTLRSDHALHIVYDAVSDKRTLINLTNHSFFNLGGHDAGSLDTLRLTVEADRFLVLDDEKLPTGELRAVSGTPMDFRRERGLSERIDENDPQLRIAGGYDHCYELRGSGMRRAALLRDTGSGITMEVLTDLPGMQLFTANFLPEQGGKGGAIYHRRGAVCFETQYFPDSIHHPAFPQCVFGAGEPYHSETVFRFGLAERHRSL